jgi:hypothetical protein
MGAVAELRGCCDCRGKRNFMGCPWGCVHSQGSGLYASKCFGINVAWRRLNWEDSSKSGKIWGNFCAPEVSSDSSLGKNLKCRGRVSSDKNFDMRWAPVCHRGSSNNHNFIFRVCSWSGESICGRRPSSEGRGRSTSSGLDMLVRSNLNLHIYMLTLPFLSHLTCVNFCGFWCPWNSPDAHVRPNIEGSPQG